MNRDIINTRKKAHQWLIGAAIVHVLSYASPMGLNNDGWQYFWGGVLVEELLYHILDPLLWKYFGYLVVGVLVPLLVLLYTSVVFCASEKDNGKSLLDAS